MHDVRFFMGLFFLGITFIFFVLQVSSIAVVKPDKAQMVESMLIRMAQTGQIQGKVDQRGALIHLQFYLFLFEQVTEAQLKQLLEQVGDQGTKKTTIKVDEMWFLLVHD